MAKQAGIIKLKGTIDDISFYKTADGHLARAKGGVSRSKLMNDPAFQRTRENGAEFGRAGRAGKLVRNAVRELMVNAKDRRVVSSLTTVLLAIIKTDPVNARGMRTVQDGIFKMLEGFNFNRNAPLSTTIFSGYTLAFDRVTGEATISLAAFSPSTSIDAPGGTTHYKLNAGAATLDFENALAQFETINTGILPYTQTEVPANILTLTLKPNVIIPVIQVLGIEFFQEVNGEFYSLKNGANNALAVVNVDTI